MEDLELFIQIRDGQPHEHPIFGDNFRMAFPNVDVENLPPNFARFVRVLQPNNEDLPVGDYQVAESHYEWKDGYVTDVWTVREMSEDERAEKRQFLLDGLESARSSIIEFINHQIETFEQEDTKLALAQWRQQIQDAVIDEPSGFIFPVGPAIDENGNLVSLDVPGTAPDVIG